MKAAVVTGLLALGLGVATGLPAGAEELRGRGTVYATDLAEGLLALHRYVLEVEADTALFDENGNRVTLAGLGSGTEGPLFVEWEGRRHGERIRASRIQARPAPR